MGKVLEKRLQVAVRGRELAFGGDPVEQTAGPSAVVPDIPVEGAGAVHVAGFLQVFGRGCGLTEPQVDGGNALGELGLRLFEEPVFP